MCMQLKHKMDNPQAVTSVQSAHRGFVLQEMAKLKEELLADNIKPVGIKLFTNDPELKELLEGGDS